MELFDHLYPCNRHRLVGGLTIYIAFIWPTSARFKEGQAICLRDHGEYLVRP